jgi:hypothetical protein
MLRALLLAALGCWAAGRAMPPHPPAEVAAECRARACRAAARLRFLGLRVYDARLWSGRPAVASDWAAAPLALEMVEYARALKGAHRRALAGGDAPPG